MPTYFSPEPGGPEEGALAHYAARGTSEETPQTMEEILREYPEEDATQVVEGVEPEDDRVRTDVRGPVPQPSTINLFQHPDAHPFVLDLALMRKYGPEWLIWEPELLEAKILMDFKTQTISDLNIDKLQAVKTLHLVDTFWQEWLVFVPCAMALSGVTADFRVLSAITVPQAMIAIDIASKLRSDLQYSLEVRTFLEVVYLHDGMLVPTDPMLDIVTVDTSRYDVDCEDVRRRWPAVRASGKAPTGASPEDVQLQRMLEAHELLEESRRQLREQLPLIYHD
jgi:hypothetical protein